MRGVVVAVYVWWLRGVRLGRSLCLFGVCVCVYVCVCACVLGLRWVGLTFVLYAIGALVAVVACLLAACCVFNYCVSNVCSTLVWRWVGSWFVRVWCLCCACVVLTLCAWCLRVSCVVFVRCLLDVCVGRLCCASLALVLRMFGVRLVRVVC